MKKIILLFLLITGCPSHAHEITFIEKPCIKAWYQYHYHTCDTLHVWVDDNLITIPKNFETDLASIPRFCWSLSAPHHSSYMGASILHDWLYHNSCYYNRSESDSIFYEALLAQGVPAWRAALMYYAVRLFGGGYYQDEDCE